MIPHEIMDVSMGGGRDNAPPCPCLCLQTPSMYFTIALLQSCLSFKCCNFLIVSLFEPAFSDIWEKMWAHMVFNVSVLPLTNIQRHWPWSDEDVMRSNTIEEAENKTKHALVSVVSKHCRDQSDMTVSFTSLWCIHFISFIRFQHNKLRK